MTITLTGSGLTEMSTRAEWGARPPKHVDPLEAVFGTTIHWEGPTMGAFSHDVCDDKVRGIQDFHMDDRGWFDIAYNAIVCPHGHAYQCRWIDVRSGANGTTIGNDTAYTVCYLGGVGDPFTPEADRAVWDVCTHLRVNGHAGPHVNGHQDWKATACPGPVIYEIVQSKRWQRNNTGGVVPPVEPPVTTEEDTIMSIVNIDGTPYCFLHMGGRDFIALNEERFWELAGAGIPVRTVSNEAFQGTARQRSMMRGKTYGID